MGNSESASELGKRLAGLLAVAREQGWTPERFDGELAKVFGVDPALIGRAREIKAESRFAYCAILLGFLTIEQAEALLFFAGETAKRAGESRGDNKVAFCAVVSDLLALEHAEFVLRFSEDAENARGLVDRRTGGALRTGRPPRAEGEA